MCPLDCLHDLARLRHLPSIYDASVVGLSVLYGVSSRILTYRQSHITMHARGVISMRESTTMEDSQHRWLQRVLETLNQTYKLQQRQGSSAPASILFMLELLSLHFHTSIDQIELLAGREGYEEAQAVYQVTQRWVETREARQSVWHAGQVLRQIRAIPREYITDFHAVGVYHVSLCLWAYVVLLARRSKSGHIDLLGPVTAGRSIRDHPDDKDIVLDAEETIDTQRWIAVGYGRPVLSDPVHGGQTLQSAEALMQICVGILKGKYPGRAVLPPATEILCNFMCALGAPTSDVSKKA